MARLFCNVLLLIDADIKPTPAQISAWNIERGQALLRWEIAFQLSFKYYACDLTNEMNDMML